MGETLVLVSACMAPEPKDAGFLSCSQYDRSDPEFRDPPECNWFETPRKPTDDEWTAISR